jgi:RNA-directed DNA polymerase
MTTKRSLVLTDSPEELKKKFLVMKDRRDVAILLDVDEKTLIYHLFVVREENKYKTFNIPKSHGGTRSISAPISTIKIIQKKFNQVLQSVYGPRNVVHSYRHDRNVITNAQPHIQSNVVLNIDLKDFFTTIHIGRVTGLLRHNPYNCTESVAKTLAQLCCFKRVLPQGAPTSPTLSNMICMSMDKDIEHLVRKHNCVYTRYADDITISTRDDELPEEILQYDQYGWPHVGEKLKEIISTNSFEINAEKVKVRGTNQRQLVTGLVTNRFLNVRREYVRQIRAMLHALEKFGLEKAEKEHHEKYLNRNLRNPSRPPPNFLKVLKGKIDYLGMVRGKENPIYISFMHKLRQIAPNIVKKEETNLQYLIRISKPALTKLNFSPNEIGQSGAAKLTPLLSEIDQYFENKRLGAWVTFNGTSPDRIAQATHSMREVLSQLLSRLAPDDVVTKAQWYVEPTAGAKVTRKMRVRCILSTKTQPASKSTVEFIESLADITEQTYGQLSKEAHKHGTNAAAQAEVCLHTCELVLLLILMNRKPAT